VSSTRSDFVEQARLANAWFSCDQHHVSLPLPRRGIAVHHKGQFLLPSNEK
jgi:hypothetical protein